MIDGACKDPKPPSFVGSWNGVVHYLVGVTVWFLELEGSPPSCAPSNILCFGQDLSIGFCKTLGSCAPETFVLEELLKLVVLILCTLHIVFVLF